MATAPPSCPAPRPPAPAPPSTPVPPEPTPIPVSPQPTDPATGGRRRRRWLRWLGSALAGHAYAALALPVGLAALAAAPLGAGTIVVRWPRGLAHRLLGDSVGLGGPADSGGPAGAPGARRPGEPAGPVVSRPGPTAGRVLGFSVVSLPVNLVAFALVVPMWAVFVARGVLYPVFGAGNLEHSWGGPTLAGAWLAHFIQGPPLLLAVTLLLRPLTRLQTELARRFLLPARDR